jgi:hypothetical protein
MTTDFMNTDASPSSVSVTVTDFAGLCGPDYQLRLDNYQRPYVWSRQKVEQLMEDLSEFSRQGKEDVYYLGTILLHRDDARKTCFVIDGQQRLSSLAVIYHALSGGELPPKLDFHYRSPLSAVNLLEARRVVAGPADPGFDRTIFDCLRFTVITVTSEDQAFSFFDTQNSRGVPLGATDLLKAFHLRAVGTGDVRQVEQLQQSCARRWEAVQVTGAQDAGKHGDFAPELFGQYLWRARNWCGQKRIVREDQESMLDTFQHRSVKGDTIDSIPLYPAHSNRFASRLRLQDRDGFRLDLAPLQVGAGAASLPFSLRQPVHQGIGFFLYAQKYAALLDELLHGPAAEPEVVALRDFRKRVVTANSRYLCELFDLALLMYADRFGSERLLEFAQRMELVLGTLRLAKQYIFREAPLKYLREADHNVLDVIAAAYRPEEVMTFLADGLSATGGFGSDGIAEIRRRKGVQLRYLDAMLTYYRKAGLPSKVPAWLADLI